jgi:hypothetical protein
VVDILNEIDEEIKQDKVFQWWKRYGAYVLGLIGAVIIGSAGYYGWMEYEERKVEERSQQFAQAVELRNQGDEEGAAQALARVADTSDSYAMLASFERAKSLINLGNTEDAVAVYDKVANDTKVDGLYRELATVFSVMQQLDTGDAEVLSNRLSPLTSEGKPFRFAALEMTALLAIRAGDVEKAKTLFGELEKLDDLPGQMKARASEYLTALSIN